MTHEQLARSKQGVLFAIAAYTMWGIAPIYFKTIMHVSAPEILSHRIIWSFVFLAIVLHIGRRWKSVRQVLTNKRQLSILAVTSMLIASNWLLFIWAVNANKMIDASLGYYINPLLNVLLGLFFLGERLRKLQWFAVLLAFIGVAIQIAAFGEVPIIALSLASSFGCYGLLRKKVNLDSQVGLFIETMLILPMALGYLVFFANTPTSNLLENSAQLNILLISAGIITTLPLLCFNGAATRLMLSTLGFFQYIGPSLMFLLAIFVYGESFTADKAITFAFIWSALVLFSLDGLNYAKNNRKRRLQSEALL